MTVTGSLIARERDADAGFTLIEIMVVVMIIGVLMAIAIPSFLAAKTRAQDRAAQADLRNGLTAEKVLYSDAQAYSSDTSTSGMKKLEVSLNWGGADSTKPALNVVVGNSTSGTNDIVCLDERSKSGTTYAVADIGSGSNASTHYANTACPAATEAAVGAMAGKW